jgi:hypothetical protein
MDSNVPLRYLREGHGPLLAIREREGDFVPAKTGPQIAEIRRRNENLTRVFASDNFYDAWIEGVGWFSIDIGNRLISVPAFSDQKWLESVIWGLPISLIHLGLGETMFHASAVELHGRAVLFAAPGGHGKTTLAGAFMVAGHRLLAEDLIRFDPFESSVYPGPAMIRLRRDVASRFSIPGTYKVAEDPDKVHFGFDRDLRGDGSAVPFGGLVFLHRSDEMKLEPIDGREALSDLWAITLNLPTAEGRARCFQQITEMAANLSIWRLTRPLTFEALPKVVDFLENQSLL